MSVSRPGPPHVSIPQRSPLLGRVLTMLLALAVALGTLAFGTPASAAPVYEIDGAWVNPPPPISRSRT